MLHAYIVLDDCNECNGDVDVSYPTSRRQKLFGGGSAAGAGELDTTSFSIASSLSKMAA
jgi:hypothetical protein